MIGQISIKTKLGWISAYEEKGKITRIKFGKYKKNILTENLKKFKSNLNGYLTEKKKY